MYWKLIVLFLSADGTATLATDFYSEAACRKAADWIVSVSVDGERRGDVLTDCILDTPEYGE